MTTASPPEKSRQRNRTQSLATLLTALSISCIAPAPIIVHNNYPAPGLSMTTSAPNREHYVPEHPGDPKVGTIYFFRQEHVSLEDMAQGADQFTIDRVGRYHHRMLKELYQLGIADVFTEGLRETFLKKIMELKEQIKERFPHGYEENPTPEQLRILAHLSGGNVYGVLEEGKVTLHYTTSDEKEKEFFAVFREQPTTDEGICRRAWILDEGREELAMSKIKEFLQRNPGKEVVLVYGMLHLFKHVFSPEFNPRMYSAVFYEGEELKSYEEEYRQWGKSAGSFYDSFCRERK